MRLNGSLLLSQRDLNRIGQAVSYIEKHYAERLTPERLSVEVKLSVRKLQAGLKQLTGHSLYAYQERVRIRLAKSYLEDTDKPLRAIAISTGFKTHSHFGENFKKHTSMTPSQYRNEFGR